MEKRDYVESMIEQLGNSLRKMLSFLIENIGKETEIEAVAQIESVFFKEFKTTIDTLLFLSEDAFKVAIIGLKLKQLHLENLSQLFFQMSISKNNFNEEKLKKLKEKALLLLDLADFTSNAVSLDRIHKKIEIQNSI